MGGENALVARGGEGFVEILSFGEFLAGKFQRQKRGVALVHVKNRRMDSERPQQANPANAEQNFLQNACSAVASVDAQAQIAIVLLIFWKVRIQQVNRAAADIHA